MRASSGARGGSRSGGGLNYARRHQYRRLFRAGRLGLASAAAALLGLIVVSVGASLAGGILLVAVMLGLRAGHWLSLAGRSRVGARSEDQVRRWRHSRNTAGGCFTPCAGLAMETSTPSRSRRPASDPRSRRRPERTTSASLAGCSSRLGGSVRAGEGGAAAGHFLSCAWFARLVRSATSVVCWWSRSTGSFRCCGKSRTGWSAVSPCG
jgi:hypothetical protein